MTPGSGPEAVVFSLFLLSLLPRTPSLKQPPALGDFEPLTFPLSAKSDHWHSVGLAHFSTVYKVEGLRAHGWGLAGSYR